MTGELSGVTGGDVIDDSRSCGAVKSIANSSTDNENGDVNWSGKVE